MFPNPSLRKLVQISEEALPPVHAPLLFGNDLYILTQEDARKIEDTRRFSIKKAMPNGDLKTINTQDIANWLQHYANENLLCNQIISNLFELLNSKRNCQWASQQHEMPQLQRQQPPANEMPYPQPMEVSTPDGGNGNIASIEQQLQWNKSVHTSSSPFPMHYSHGTSTTEFNYESNGGKDRQNTSATCSCSKICPQCRMWKNVCNKSINTQELQNNGNTKSNEALDAREQLKKKKLRFFFT